MDSLICASCGRPIRSAFVKALGKAWHSEHFTCAACGRSLVNVPFFERGGKIYCELDYKNMVGVKCAVCGKVIEGKYLKNYWNDVYCARHQDELPLCSNCGRPISTLLTRGGVDFGDGRYCCNICTPKILGEREVNERVLPRLVEFYKNYELPLTDLVRGVPVHLVDAREMARQAQGDSLHPVTGLIKKVVKIETRGTRQTQSKRIQEILILKGLTEIAASGVLAHEIGHAYMFAHDFPPLPPIVEEGMAEIFSFLWLRSRKGPEVAFRLNLIEINDNPIYGEGYQTARRYMSERGFWALLDYVKEHAQFPRL
ncbi:MAG: protein DA1 [Candidatus Lokiarchaeota archaeon]|nr:protein DA1 [Candidatus Lokiarchaeota archaeon]